MCAEQWEHLSAGLHQASIWVRGCRKYGKITADGQQRVFRWLCLLVL